MATPLSEKAKGKQRAVDLPNVGQASSSTQQLASRDLTIRFTEGGSDLIVHVGEKDTVKDVKQKIRHVRPELQRRRLRLIHSGRLLTDGTFVYSWLTSLEDKQQRAVREVTTEEVPIASRALTWLHCSVGPELTQEEEEETLSQATQIKPLRGFDRLAAAGFTEEDIASIRQQFHAQSAGDYLDRDFASEEDYEEHARALEEQWIDSLDNAATASLSQVASGSSTSTLLQGIITGVFFGLLPFFFFREPKPPVFWEDGSEFEVYGSVVFSKRMQMGIVIGFLVNVALGIWIYTLADN
ncbi:hypothetical protein BDM02DRAFT_3103492 [Thelephora ganbajun]|uniref:Uncharacterized protein n=1 Tax=Thelephora ganbajun TaxID=370292 RepID=A0ACB6Z4I6_THEGA|nr:hypothetical protein BDM02DRAFT_3103492 [Thelephora ganbajun]